jgi:Leucine-rich repeat (LRR) protein
MARFHEDLNEHRNTLFLEESQLREVPNLSHTKETHISLDKNNILEIEATYLPPGIQFLSMRKNLLRSDDIQFNSPLLHLHTLLLDNNDLTFIDASFIMCANLRILSLRGNKLSKVDFPFLTSLEILYIDKNPIQTLDRLPQNLHYLSASDCSIRMIQSRLPPKLENINFSGNKLQYAGLPFTWGSVESVDLSFNHIQRFPKGFPQSLKTLNLQCNGIETLPSTLPKGLQYLNIRKNKLRELPSSPGPSLEIVFASQNKLCFAEDEKPSWVKYIYMDQNWNTLYHNIKQKIIKRYWRAYRLKKRIRIYGRTKHIYSELIEVALSPEHILQTDVFSSEWNLAR